MSIHILGAQAAPTGRRRVTSETIFLGHAPAVAPVVESPGKSATQDRRSNAFIFSPRYGQPWNYDSWKKPFENAVKAVQLPASVGMYSLRQAISEMIASGIASFEVARMAGTSNEMIDKCSGPMIVDTSKGDNFSNVR